MFKGSFSWFILLLRTQRAEPSPQTVATAQYSNLEENLAAVFVYFL
jgi:hypothetical protein